MRLARISTAIAAFFVSSPVLAEDFATVSDVANSAALCMLSAGKDGADTSRFEGNGWTSTEDGYRHMSAPVKIEFPSDDDGIRRICVVHAALADRKAQDEVAEVIATMLKAQPIEQSESKVWVISTANGPRGIQFFIDQDSDQPQVRLVGAAF